MPYNYEILHTVINEASYIWDLEVQMHKSYKHHNYNPKIKFGGIYECYNNNLPIHEILEL